MLISYVLGGASHGHGMDELAQRVLDYDCITYASLCGKGAAQIGFAQVPVDKATAYAAEDAEVTLRLWQALRPRLLEERMLAVYETLDRPLSPIVTEMERHGIKVDAHRLRSLSGEFTQRMAALRGPGLPARRPQLQPGLAQAAGRGAVRRAEPRRGRAARPRPAPTPPASRCSRSWRCRATSCRG